MRKLDIFRLFEKIFPGFVQRPLLATPQGAEAVPGGPVLFAKKRTSSGSSDDRRQVDADRRRKTTSTGQRERATAPRRDKPSSSTRPPAVPPSQPPSQPPGGGGYYGLPPSSGSGSGGMGFPGAGSGGSSGGMGGLSPMMLLIGGGILILLCVGGFMLFSGGFGGFGGGAPASVPQAAFGGSQGAQNQPAPAVPQQPAQPAAQQPAQSASNFSRPEVGEGDSTWLVMLYQDADDKILEKDIYVDLNEAERIGSSDNVHIVSQVDRYRAGYTGDGNWTDTRRYYLSYDPDLDRIASEEVMNLGEVNMADGDSLVDFVTWAVETYPADKHVLIMSDHGMGWPGGWTDPAPGGRGDHNVALASTTGDQIFLMELDEALGEIRRRTGIDKLELIGLDACLMAHVEVFETLAPHARYAVASQEVEPALGWAYTGFLTNLLSDPDMDGSKLGEHIVETYINEDQRITDDAARLAWVGRGVYGIPSREQLTRQLSDDITLTAVDLEKMPQVMDALNNLAYLLQGDSQQSIAQARNYAQSFTSVFGRSVPPSYLDLSNLAALIQRNSRDPQVQGAVDELQASIRNAVIVERHGAKKPGANGMSIYFPNSQLYRNRVAGAASYVEVATRFADNSLWDDFLAYHYTGREFGPAEASLGVPAPAAQVVAPGSGEIIVSPLQLSTDNVDIGETVTLSADIEGDNIGYIKFFAGFLDEASNSIYVADTDYLESGETRAVGGVYYPDWGSGPFTLTFDWEPIVFAINDGEKRVTALFEPEVFGASADDAVYSVDGIYTYADGETYRATMYFNNSDGLMREVFGFAGDGTNGAPREIIPTDGDTFTVLEQWLDLGSGGQPAQSALEPGDTAVFGNQQLAWIDLDAAAGPYVVGFLIEDLDGNVYPVYEEVRVN
jgi:hypothetical protein